MIRTLTLAAFSILPLHAQDGGQLYTLYCSACHGPDGKGATGGSFPPLAGSAWVAGDAARPVKILLHGLHGPVEVGERTYNLEMPPQGSVLSDGQIASILTYVRGAWGNKEAPLSAEFVKATRDAISDHKTMWTSEEILKLHPLPKPEPPIAHLISQIYEGEWQTLPDFSKLKPTSVEEEQDGLLSLKRVGLTNQFGIVWEGEISASETGDYLFRVDADDGARILVNGTEVVRVDGIGAMDGSRVKQRGIPLTAGVHKLRVEYFEYQGEQGITAAWRGPGIPDWKKLSDAAPRQRGGPQRDPIPVKARNNRAVVYRNFIAGTTPRAIGIGFPGEVNLAYSADNLGAALIWTGDFIDASRHWLERGQGSQPPAGERVVELVGSAALPKEARFRGYKLDPAGNPTFSAQIGDQFLLDGWKPTGSGTSPALARTLALTGQGAAVEILLADQNPVQQSGDNQFTIGNDIIIISEGTTPVTRDGKLYLKLSPGGSAALTYRWK